MLVLEIKSKRCRTFTAGAFYIRRRTERADGIRMKTCEGDLPWTRKGCLKGPFSAVTLYQRKKIRLLEVLKILWCIGRILIVISREICFRLAARRRVDDPQDSRSRSSGKKEKTAGSQLYSQRNARLQSPLHSDWRQSYLWYYRGMLKKEKTKTVDGRKVSRIRSRRIAKRAPAEQPF